MSNTTRHKIHAKYMNGIIPIEAVPRTVLNAWDRHNFDRGFFRKQRAAKVEAIQDRQAVNDLLEVVRNSDKIDRLTQELKNAESWTH